MAETRKTYNIMKDTLKKTWDYLNGNKTIICMTTATILQQAINAGILSDSKALSFAIGVSITLGTGSLAHHVKKGYFRANKK